MLFILKLEKYFSDFLNRILLNEFIYLEKFFNFRNESLTMIIIIGIIILPVENYRCHNELESFHVQQ